MNTLVTLFALRQHIGLADDDTRDDARLLAVLVAATNAIEARTRRIYTPYQATLAHSIDPRRPRHLSLYKDLLSLQGIVNGDGTSPALADVQALRDGTLYLRTGGFVYRDTPQNAVQVTGIWGYHPQWDDAWASTGDSVQDASLSASATAITVTAATAPTTQGTPRFQVGQLLQIEAEYLRVLEVDDASNTLTVARGVRGTTAQSHVQGQAIAVYHPPARVAMLCLQWAHWLYKVPDMPATGLPTHLIDTLDSLRRIRAS
jgi:hypothetical protein